MAKTVNPLVWTWGFILTLALVLPGYAQESTGDLLIQAEDTCLEKTHDPGLHLFIRKKPAIASVLLTESTKDSTSMEDTYSYRTLEWNAINGNELRFHASGQGKSWFLLDSSPEPHPLLGEAFHIYIPPVIVYGAEGARHGTIHIADGVYINIRTFALPYADYSGGFKDNPFTLSITQSVEPDPPDAAILGDTQSSDQDILGYSPAPESPNAGEEVHPLPLDPPLFPPPNAEPLPPTEEAHPIPVDPETAKIREEIRLIPVDPETIKLMEEVRDLLKENASPAPLPGAPAKEPFVFAPIINAGFGLRVFLPGPEGILLPSLQLRNDYGIVGGLSLTQYVTKTLRLRLEFDRDPFLMNRIITRVGWNIGTVEVEAGPYFGILNTDSGSVSPGLSVFLIFRISRWNLSGSFRLDSALGRDLIGPGDYTLSYGSGDVSYDFPLVRFTLGVIERTSTYQDRLRILRIGQWIRYNLSAEIAPSHKPWGLRIDLGYQRLHWTYQIPLQPLEYRYFDVYAGLEGSYTVLPGLLTFFAGLEAPIYPFVYPDIQSLEDPQRSFFGKATLGLRWTPGRQNAVQGKPGDGGGGGGVSMISGFFKSGSVPAYGNEATGP